ncbi:low temperature requirement protein A [Nocardioides daejeonensis]|uniref:low temperature requirement protein A n=1 Tax=Nocardioides daejeonensis TaxID=1046556 RepID=UPI000D74E00C|nr:low temperature requirement protein A [Nocardioides daejeonensis]
MRPRDPLEPVRAASSLELFFDLVFVIAVSIAAGQLHHAMTEGHALEGLRSYAVVFFGIWWAWMNFTWFATSFDTDDWLYRVVTFVQMGGVLVLAAGVEPAFVDGDFTVLVLAYVVMRVAMVAQWLRASRRAGPAREATLRYAGGIALVQVLWLGMLLLDGPIATVVLVGLIAAEISVPVLAERRGQTPWHAHHITERYGCFTLILLGESLLASATAIIGALHAEEELTGLIAIAVLTLVVTAALWWVYFWPPHHESIGALKDSLSYGYGHYFVFAAAGAFSAGVEVEIDVLTGHSALDELAASFTVTVPIAVFLLGVWLVAIRKSGDRVVDLAVLAAAALVLLDPLIPIPFAITAVVMAALVAVLVVREVRAPD